MKKFIVILLVILCTAGVIYLGYLIFNAKNVQAVELEGEMQTLYVVGDDIDFEDAKLKVTYKNGDIKMVDLDSKNVNIDMFSTSIEKKGTMNIVYKNFVVNVDYIVIKNGCYYLEKHENTVWNYEQNKFVTTITPNEQGYNQNTTTEIIYLNQGGVIQYYEKDGNKWYMNDGNYDASYNYVIEKDTLIVNTGKDKIEIKANYDNRGNLSVTSTVVNVDETSGLIYEKNVSTYKWYNMKTNRNIKHGSLEIDLSKTEYVSETVSNSLRNYVVFKRGENIETSGKEIYVKVEFENDEFLHIVYVRVVDSMVQRNSLQTENPISPAVSTAILFYEKEEFTLHYTVTY